MSCSSCVSENAPSGRKSHHGGALVAFAAGAGGGRPPMPQSGIVRVGEHHEDAACLCGIEPNKGHAEEVSRSEQRP